ncbi:MAG: hypothetical protein L6V87_02335 [Ruminococcus sp.]|nr:MAG: hypothetical protein L6V87_02335 [Ruminococcus sp.]
MKRLKGLFASLKDTLKGTKDIDVVCNAIDKGIDILLGDGSAAAIFADRFPNAVERYAVLQYVYDEIIAFTKNCGGEKNVQSEAEKYCTLTALPFPLTPISALCANTPRLCPKRTVKRLVGLRGGFYFAGLPEGISEAAAAEAMTDFFTFWDLLRKQKKSGLPFRRAVSRALIFRKMRRIFLR